jgi:hypothetical protein
MILIKTNHPYLRVGCHRWYQSIMDIIHRVRSYLGTIVVLIGGKLTGFDFLYLLYVILLFSNDTPITR